MKTNRTTKAVAAAALLLAGLGAGVALGASGSASADAEQGYGPGTGRSTGTPPDPSKSQRSDEKLLTGSTAAKVKAAALEKYPNATVERVETDSEGVYEAHIVTSAGDHVIVQVGKDFAVTGTQTGRGHGGPGGPRHGDGDGDGPGAPPEA